MNGAKPESGGRRRVVIVVLALAVIIAAAAAANWWRARAPSQSMVEHAMPVATDMPTTIIAARDGSVWFSLDFANAIGLLRDGKISRFTKHGQNVDALGLAVDGEGNAWYADSPAVAILRFSPSGEMQSYPLGTPIARLGRMAMAPDGSIWFAESTSYSVTRLKDGVLTRHVIQSVRGGPFGVTVGADGTVWATLQSGNQILRIEPSGKMEVFEIPTRASAPSDIVVDKNGAVWFLEFRANSIGRLEAGKFTEYPVPEQNAALSGLAIAADGSIWFGMLRKGSLGRLRDGKFHSFPLPRADARPISVSVDTNGNVWYADIRGYVGMLAADQAKR